MIDTAPQPKRKPISASDSPFLHSTWTRRPPNTCQLQHLVADDTKSCRSYLKLWLVWMEKHSSYFGPRSGSRPIYAVLSEAIAPTCFRNKRRYIAMSQSLDTSQIKNWRSIVTLIVFVFTSEYNSGKQILSLQLNHFILYRSRRAFPISYSHLRSSSTFERRYRYFECLAHHLLKARPLTTWIRQ